MPLFKTCAVLLTGDKEVYARGERVSGTLVLDVNEDIVVKGVRVYLYGESLAKWEEFSPGRLGGTKDYVAREKYFNQVQTVFGKKQKDIGPNVTLPSGRHKYDFAFRFNTQKACPSSYEGEYGGIRYWIKVEVDRPFPHFNQNWYRGITVLDKIDVNERQYKAQVRRQNKKQISKALGFGDAGTLTLTSSTDRGAYCAGEKIALSVVVTNETTKDLGKLKAQIVQKVLFKADDESKTRETVLRVLEGSAVMKGEERVWKDVLLEIDATPPTTKESSCDIVIVSYYVKVLVEVPMGNNLDVDLPVTIGTVPYGHITAQTARGATAASSGVDVSSDITYTKCSRGFQTCRKSDGNFPNYNYVPVCAYVSNYEFPPPQRPSPVPAARPAAANPAAGTAKTKTQTVAPQTLQPTVGATARPTNTPAPASALSRAPASAPSTATVHPLELPHPQRPAPAPAARPAFVPVPIPTTGSSTPTAPPLDLPPAYEDVVRMNDPATEEEVLKPEKADKPYGVLLLRFPDDSIQEFRKTIKKETKSLIDYEGEVIAFAPQPIAEPEQWPERTSIAMLKFASVPAATDWFTKTPGVADPSWLGSCDVLVGTLIEHFKEANRIFSMTKVKYQNGLTKAKAVKYQTLSRKTYVPLRLKKRGVLLLGSNQFKTLRGEWLEKGWYLTVSQWESLEKYFEYKHEREQDKYKEINDMSSEILENRHVLKFQSEDLSRFHVPYIQTMERSESPDLEIQSGVAQIEETEVPCQTSLCESTEQINETDISSQTTPSKTTEQCTETEVPCQTSLCESTEQINETDISSQTTPSKPTEQCTETEVTCETSPGEYAEQINENEITSRITSC